MPAAAAGGRAEASGAGEEDDGRPDFSKPYRAFGHPRHASRCGRCSFTSTRRSGQSMARSKIQIQYEHLDSDDPASEGFAEDGQVLFHRRLRRPEDAADHRARAAAGRRVRFASPFTACRGFGPATGIFARAMARAMGRSSRRLTLSRWKRGLPQTRGRGNEWLTWWRNEAVGEDAKRMCCPAG